VLALAVICWCLFSTDLIPLHLQLMA